MRIEFDSDDIAEDIVADCVSLTERLTSLAKEVDDLWHDASKEGFERGRAAGYEEGYAVGAKDGVARLIAAAAAAMSASAPADPAAVAAVPEPAAPTSELPAGEAALIAKIVADLPPDPPAEVKPISLGVSMKWSPERKDQLKARYADANPSDLLASVNALPGARITLAQMHGYANTAMGLRRMPSPTLGKLRRGQLTTTPPENVEAPRPANPAKLPIAPVSDETRPGRTVEATFGQIRDWSVPRGIHYDGGNIDIVNRKRSQFGLAPFIQVAFGSADTI